jgi:hypothetical protein
MNKARVERGQEEMSEEESISHQASMQAAIDSGLTQEADAIADKVLRSSETKKTKTYQMSVEEVAALGARTAELRVERDGLLRRKKDAMNADNKDLVGEIDVELAQNIQNADNIEFALKTSGTASGRANSMMASLLNKFTYDVVGLADAGRAAANRKLTFKEEASLIDSADQIASLEQQIADLEEQIRTGVFAEKGKRKVKDEPKELTDLKTKKHQLEREAREKIYNLRKKTARDWLKEWATLPRSMMATADMSYGLRQGLLPSFAHPKIATKTWGKAFQSFFSQFKADEIDLQIRSHPLFQEMVRLGTHFSSLDSAIENRTEFFASNLAERIWGFGKVVRASERNMVTGINLLRQGLMTDFLTKHPDASEEAKKAYAKYVNVATGRGEAKVLDRVGEELSLAFFAPRFAVSRIQAPFLAAQNLQHPELRGEMVKQWGAYLGTGLSVLALAKMAGAEVGDDPEDSDFGKIIIDGNKRIDIWGGIQQPMRILAKAIKSGIDMATEGETDIDPITDIGRFLRYKLSPPMLMLNESLSGKDTIGRETEKIEVGNVEIPTPFTLFVKNMTPLVIQSAVEAYNEGETPLAVAALATGEGLGLSIGVYDKD